MEDADTSEINSDYPTESKHEEIEDEDSIIKKIPETSTNPINNSLNITYENDGDVSNISSNVSFMNESQVSSYQISKNIENQDEFVENKNISTSETNQKNLNVISFLDDADNIIQKTLGCFKTNVVATEAENNLDNLSENFEHVGDVDINSHSKVFAENEEVGTNEDISIQNISNKRAFTDMQANDSFTSDSSSYASVLSDESSSDDEKDENELETEGNVKKGNKTSPSEGKKKVKKEEKSKGELAVEDLPPIEDLRITVPKEECLPIGVVHSIVDFIVVVQALEGTPALDLDSIIFSENGGALSKIFDVFGPITRPFYLLRLASRKKVESHSLKIGSTLYCAPQTEHTSYVFTSQLMKQRGSDASWRNDCEPPPECLEYSDDEEEMQAKKQIKQVKSENKTNDYSVGSTPKKTRSFNGKSENGVLPPDPMVKRATESWAHSSGVNVHLRRPRRPTPSTSWKNSGGIPSTSSNQNPYEPYSFFTSFCTPPPPPPLMESGPIPPKPKYSPQFISSLPPPPPQSSFMSTARPPPLLDQNLPSLPKNYQNHPSRNQPPPTTHRFGDGPNFSQNLRPYWIPPPPTPNYPPPSLSEEYF